MTGLKAGQPDVLDGQEADANAERQGREPGPAVSGPGRAWGGERGRWGSAHGPDWGLGVKGELPTRHEDGARRLLHTHARTHTDTRTQTRTHPTILRGATGADGGPGA